MDYKYIGGLGHRSSTSQDKLRWWDFNPNLTDEERKKRCRLFKKMPSGNYVDVPTSSEVKLMKKAFRKDTKSTVELRWHEIWVSEEEVKDLFFEYGFTTQAKAAKFLGDLLMGIRNHSDLVDVDDEGNWIDENKFGYVICEFNNLKEVCKLENLDPNDFKLFEVQNFHFVVDKDEL